MLNSTDSNIYFIKVIPKLQEQLKKNNLTCENCFLNAVFAIQEFVKYELMIYQWCPPIKDVEKCYSSLKMSNVLNQKVFFLLTPNINEVGTFSSFFDDNTTNFQKNLLARLTGNPTNVSISDLVYTLSSTDSAENNMTRFEMDSIPRDVLFTIMKESLLPPHILHFESIGFTSSTNMSFVLPSKDLVGYPMVKNKPPIETLPYLFNREPLIPLCDYKPSDVISIEPIYNFCKMFRWSLTDLGICYSANGLEDSVKSLKNSGFKDAFQKVFGMAETGRGLYYAEGIGTKKGLRIVLDAHATTSTYRKIKTKKNNYFKVTFHEADSFPLVGLEGLKIEAGYKTTVTLKAPNLIANDSIRCQFHQPLCKVQKAGSFYRKKLFVS